ncbi:pro-FMRFamide-related neuropeptide VF [Engraulis encrasicolus]|uniref:pro-FMRFamide-related neuropeptide VF n=1 Tax=Engraulis encrasicolus TaxID=184585 RepID=UPI002FD4BD10
MTASVMPTTASEEGDHIGQRTQYMTDRHRRSFNIEDFPLTVVPTSARVSSPLVLRLHPPVAKPSHLNANLPLRFGRSSETTESEQIKEQHQTSSKSSFLNLPQRFGRQQEDCSRCARSGAPPSATLPQRFGRRHALNFLAFLPFRKTASILVPASKSSEVELELRRTFDDNSSDWTEDTIAGDSLWTFNLT